MKAFFDRIDTPSIIAITLIAALVALTFVLVFHTIPEGTSDVFKLLVGSLLTLAGTIVTFFFGSSSGSKDKDVARDKALNSAIGGLAGNPAPAAPIVPPEIKAALAFVAVLIASLIFAAPAFAQLKPLPPLKPLTGNLANDLNPGSPTAVAPGLPGLLIGGQSKEDLIKLWQSIQKASTADLTYAIAMATLANKQAPTGITTGAAMRLSCLTAIQTLNGQIGGTGLVDSAGKPMVRPDPALFTDAETFAEVIDAVQPGGPLWTSCAGAAQLAATSTVAFVNALVSGAAGLALLAPK
jgi:hypothetical protein